MYRKISITITAIAFFLVTFGVVLSVFSHTDPSKAQVASGSIAGPHNWGIPAIPVKQAAITTTGTAFSANDVTLYLNTHPCLARCHTTYHCPDSLSKESGCRYASAQ